MNALLWTITTTWKRTQVYYWRTFCLFKELFYYYSITKGRWWKEMDHGQHTILTCCASLVLKKAFDVIDHSTLLNKLEYSGIWDNVFRWFQDYVCNRKQYVQVNGTASDKRIISHGVPQKKKNSYWWKSNVCLCRRHWSASLWFRSGGTCKWRSTECRL